MKYHELHLSKYLWRMAIFLIGKEYSGNKISKNDWFHGKTILFVFIKMKNLENTQTERFCEEVEFAITEDKQILVLKVN